MFTANSHLLRASSSCSALDFWRYILESLSAVSVSWKKWIKEIFSILNLLSWVFYWIRGNQCRRTKSEIVPEGGPARWVQRDIPLLEAAHTNICLIQWQQFPTVNFNTNNKCRNYGRQFKLTWILWISWKIKHNCILWVIVQCTVEKIYVADIFCWTMSTKKNVLDLLSAILETENLPVFNVLEPFI